tara:strand:+ start:10411 stop:11601 length:1191 start_codon:yes stop_codon:yes gene_type:complete
MTFLQYLKKCNFFYVFAFTFYLLDPFSYGYVFAYLLMTMMVLNKGFIANNLDRNFLFLFIFSFVYAIFYAFDLALGVQFIFIYALFPVGFYMLGKYFLNFNPKANNIFLLFYILGILYSLPAMLSVLGSIIADGFVVVERDVPMIWDGHIIPATNMASYFALNMCIPSILLVKFKKSTFFFKVISIAVFVLSIICILRLGSRTQISIMAITFLVSLIYMIRKQSVSQNLVLFGFLFLVINGLLGYVSFDKDSDVMSAFAGRMDSKKYGAATAGGRTERWEKSLINLVEKPLGWKVEEFGFSHNLWFDVARVAGTLAFFLLIIYTLRSFFQIKKAIGFQPNNLLINLMFLSLGMSFYLLFFVEPIFDGYFTMFILFCFYMGSVNKYLENGRLQKSLQ